MSRTGSRSTRKQTVRGRRHGRAWTCGSMLDPCGERKSMLEVVHARGLQWTWCALRADSSSVCLPLLLLARATPPRLKRGEFVDVLPLWATPSRTYQHRTQPGICRATRAWHITSWPTSPDATASRRRARPRRGHWLCCSSRQVSIAALDRFRPVVDPLHDSSSVGDSYG